jgi:hypothetical protein
MQQVKMLVVVVTTPHVAITTLERIQLVNQRGQLTRHLHRHHHLLADVHFHTHTQSIEALAVGKQQLQFIQTALKLLFVVVQLHRLHLHLQPLIAILASATEALVDNTVMELLV